MPASDRVRAAVLGALVGDALSLGVHWVYDPIAIREAVGRVTNYAKPTLTTYHPTKDAGDFSHYGDQNLHLLKAVSASRAFDAAKYSAQWRELMQTYEGYRDSAAKKTLENYAAGMTHVDAGSTSTDVSGAGRCAMLLPAFSDEAGLVAASKGAVGLTHNSPLSLAVGELVARVLFRVAHAGTKPSEALAAVAKEMGNAAISELVAKGLSTRGEADDDKACSFGDPRELPNGRRVYSSKSCDVKFGLPVTVHFIAKYEDRSLEDALVENAMIGGDSCGRAQIIGAVLGAYRGTQAIPQRWVDGLRSREAIERALAAF